MIEELDVLVSARPDVTPDEATVARHRAELRAAMARRSPRRWRRPGGLGLAAAAAVVAAVALSDDGGNERVSVGPREQPSTVTTAAPAPAAPTSACGDDPPAAVQVPAAASGPLSGPAPGARPPEEGQLVAHWLVPDGSVELRWPATPAPVYDLQTPRGSGAWTMASHPDRTEIDVGTDDVFSPDVVIATVGAVESAECAIVEITATAGDLVVRTGFDLDDATTVDLTAVVTAQVAGGPAPTEAARCQGADANGTPPNRFGEGDGGVHAEPVDALRAFLSGRSTFAQSGYTEFAEDDGTYTYAQPLDGGEGWVVVVSVVPSGDGWTVDAWTSSGC